MHELLTFKMNLKIQLFSESSWKSSLVRHAEMEESRLNFIRNVLPYKKVLDSTWTDHNTFFLD